MTPPLSPLDSVKDSAIGTMHHDMERYNRKIAFDYFVTEEDVDLITKLRGFKPNNAANNFKSLLATRDNVTRNSRTVKSISRQVQADDCSTFLNTISS